MTALRRADWRFLLPSPEGTAYRRLVLFGGTADLLDRLGSVAEERRLGPEGVEEADLVVVMADSAEPVSRILPRVGPHATLYVEVDRRRKGSRLLTPARLRRCLVRRGLTPIAAHWAIPDFSRARRHIPLDSVPALEWYLQTLQTAGSPLTRAADAGIRLLARAGPPTLAACVPCYSITAVGAGRRRAPVGVLAPAAAPVAMITSGQDDGSRVVLLPFETERPAPSRVVKVSRLHAFEGHTEREQHTLAELRRRLPTALRDLVPEPLGMRRWGGLLVASETYAPGTPMVVTSGRYGAPFAGARADLRYAVDWMIAFHRATTCDGRWNREWAERAASRFDRCQELFAPASTARGLLTRAARAARELEGAAVPLVPLHNDLGPWNLHRDGARVTAIDWELGAGDVSDRVGPGPCDLFYFTTCWYFRLRHLSAPNEELRGLRELFTERGSGNRASNAVAEEIRRYTSELGTTGALLPVLLVATWVERALEWRDRASLGRPDAPGAAGNRYARYIEVLAEPDGAWFDERRWS